MDNRPNMLDLRSNSNNSATSSGSKPLRSPRVHVAGEVPPELSPLDAFAMHSRLLAKQLQETTKDGQRLSRLPPLTPNSPLVMQGRSGYFRSMSNDSASDLDEASDQDVSGLGLKTAFEDAFATEQRPQSMHPRMGRMPPSTDEWMPPVPQFGQDQPRGRSFERTGGDYDFLGLRRECSPSSMSSDARSQQDRLSDRPPRSQDNAACLPSPSPLQNASSSAWPEKTAISFDNLGLAPPRPMFPNRSSSIMSSPHLPPEDEPAVAASSQSLPPRKLSSGSSALANPMPSPAPGSFHRSSPSAGSESSALPRPSFNFSRPLSRAGTPSFDMPSRQTSSDSQPSFILADESAQTPVSMHSEAFLDQQQDDGKSPATSYIYSKFSLPRGKSLQRSEPSDAQPSAFFKWEQPIISHSNVQRYPKNAPPSPPSRPLSFSGRIAPEDAIGTAGGWPRPSLDPGKRSLDSASFGSQAQRPQPPQSPRTPGRPSNDGYRTSEDSPRGRTLTPKRDAGGIRGRTPASTATSDSASTIRPPPTARSMGLSVSEMSAEDHLAKGIECHEHGSVNESTYHLRHAARGNNPTGMLLYALACRHGWGMRPNQKEGVEWLRKAAEYASVEIADDQDQAKEGKHVDVVGMRTRKAQFALSIYELGVSHMNGWGIEQDKALGLRCFEIAGSWGDVDALAEAGFCYAQGIGCKKDLKKSAKFYRMAEAKGMNMVGNSWIHKPKYSEDDENEPPNKNKKKARSKSRTRTMFGLKSGS